MTGTVKPHLEPQRVNEMTSNYQEIRVNNLNFKEKQRLAQFNVKQKIWLGSFRLRIGTRIEAKGQKRNLSNNSSIHIHVLQPL